jgi:hypothetical protein
MEHVVERQKPGSWALEQQRTPPDTAHLWQDLNLALPLWEGAGRFVEDVSGLNLHSGTWGTGVTWTRGELGPGLDFDGSSSANFQIADPPANYLDSCSAFSLDMWFEVDSVTGIHGLVGKYRATAGMRSWRLYTNGTELTMQVSADGTAYEEKSTSGAGLATGTLYHLVMTWNAGTWVVRLNGAAVTANAFTTVTSIYAGTDYVLVGKRYDGYYLDGRIYSIRFWQRALAAEDLAILYELPFRMFEQDFDFPSLALLHIGTTPAGEWELAGEVENDVEEFYLSGLENAVSYDVYCTTVDISGNESTGCSDESATPVGGTGGVYAPLRRGISVAPCVPPVIRRYR